MSRKGHTPAAVRAEPDAFKQNRMLFECLRDDDARARFYDDLAQEHFPVLRFKSLLRDGPTPTSWPDQDVYLLSSREDVETALQGGSVRAYAELDSGGKFMLGVDDPARHARQRWAAELALRLTPAEIQGCVREALARAMVLPERLDGFDLVKDVALQVAVRFIAVVFGMTARSHVHLELAMMATYRRLTFQIIGRHFASDDGLPSANSQRTRKIRRELEEFVCRAAEGADFPEWWDRGLLQKDKSVSMRIADHYGTNNDMPKTVILGLMAGTVGNITAAITNTIDHFFRTPDAKGGMLIDEAARLARSGNSGALRPKIDQALLRRPPAPFLARSAVRGMQVGGIVVPEGAHLLLAMGADPKTDLDLLFGGAWGDRKFPHNCIGRHLALPLVREAVQQVLALPGLARSIDPATGEPYPLEKTWGSVCEKYPLRYQRDRRLNQQPLFLVLKIKEPVGVNAMALKELTRAGAAVVERALNDARNVHFAWFGLVENDTHLAMYTVYDGDFYAYVEHFALKVPLFDEQFKYLEGAPPTPVRQYPREFVEFIRANNKHPVADYFYSAYPKLGVAEIYNRGLGRP